MLICPGNKSPRNRQPKFYVPAKSRKSQWCEANIISIEIFAPFQFVPVCVKTREYQLCSKWWEQRGRIRRFASTVAPVYPNASRTVCSSEFVF